MRRSTEIPVVMRPEGEVVSDNALSITSTGIEGHSIYLYYRKGNRMLIIRIPRNLSETTARVEYDDQD